MSAEVLREAAALMRERAEAATPGPWCAVAGGFGLPSDGPDHMRVTQAPPKGAADSVCRLEWERQGGEDAEHIAAWHPAVALAVADWLDAQAEHVASRDCEAHCAFPDGSPQCVAALAVARAYLGATP